MDLAHAPKIRLGGMEVRPSTREIVFEGGREVIEPRVMSVLVRLATAKGEVVTREELQESCWDGRIVSDDAINRVISRIRRLSELTEGRDFTLETITKVGYRLAAPPAIEGAIPTPAHPVAAPSAVDSQDEAAQEAYVVRPLTRPPAVHGPRRYLLAFAILVVVVVAGLAGWRMLASKPPAAPVESTAPLTLAVLPFDNLGSSGGDDVLAIGLSRDIRNTLSRVRGLRVVSDASSFAVDREKLSTGEIRAQLSADLIIDGSLTREGDTIRLDAELVDATNGVNIWTGTESGPAGDLDRVRELISSAIFEQLVARLGPNRVAITSPPKPGDPRIYQLLLEAEELQNKVRLLRRTGASDEAFDIGDRVYALVEKALAIDPNAAGALTLKAEIQTNATTRAAWNEKITRSERFARGAEDLRRALAADPDNVRALTALGENYRREQWRWSDARSLFERAIALDPNNANARIFYSFYLSGAGRCVEGMEHARVAARINASVASGSIGDFLQARMLKCLGRLRESDAMYRHALAVDRANLFALSEVYLGFLSRGDASGLRELIRYVNVELSDGAPTPSVQATLDRIALAADALEGRPTAFRAFLEDDFARFTKSHGADLPSSQGRRTADSYWTYAVEFSWAGETDKAIDVLGQALANGSLYIPETMPYGANEFPPAMRDDPRYQALWRSDPRIVELMQLRLEALQRKQMMGRLPDGTLVKPTGAD